MKRTVVLQVMVDEDTAQVVRDMAKAQERPVSFFLARLISGYIGPHLNRDTRRSESSDLLGNSWSPRKSNARTAN